MLHIVTIFCWLENRDSRVEGNERRYFWQRIGWFSVFTADKSVDKPILLISMVENVKGIGGSGYVCKKDATVLDEYFEG